MMDLGFQQSVSHLVSKGLTVPAYVFLVVLALLEFFTEKIDFIFIVILWLLAVGGAFKFEPVIKVGHKKYAPALFKVALFLLVTGTFYGLFAAIVVFSLKLPMLAVVVPRKELQGAVNEWYWPYLLPKTIYGGASAFLLGITSLGLLKRFCHPKVKNELFPEKVGQAVVTRRPDAEAPQKP